MKLLVALPTKSANDPLISLGEEYLKKVRPPLVAHWLMINPKIASLQEHERKDIEGKELLLKTEGYYRITLTERGKHMTSEDFARMIDRLKQTTSRLAFLIGGAYGLSDIVVKKSNTTFSLSPLTMPHRMAFLVLAEQLYRAGEIIFGSPYHK